ncbi:MAG: cob(I)yrinic acid a,c-diamide adenosyltransferase [Candidatus Thermoplasmatota archaeon]|jgi:cob(I)alamin adenosyltransferase|nr:cob(I)yrinic acid a,c-diamide adenosyltransferase [Candidatus Thermoplasmatota archaeon]MDP7266276.1 cob(I)yrinic acid a,c-diamide adenosyltransferase [Candidatus Thermoplasmatota archaeon]
MKTEKERKGLVQLYTGNGKGKTTAALGLSLRASGKGLSVYIIQFMKGRINYGELESVKRLPLVSIEQFGRPDFVDKANPAPIDIDLAVQGLARAREIISAGEHDIVVLDEINVALDFRLIPVTEVVDMVKDRPQHVEIVLTGRDAPRSLIDLADLVSVVVEVKHPYREGVQCREGIEF